MYPEDQLWIADELEIELPITYWSAIIRYPFLDHLGSIELAFWDDPEEIIKQTKKRREGSEGMDPWPHKWIKIGQHKDGPYALNCNNGKIRVAIGGDIRNPGLKLRNIQALIDIVHDGYRGKLPWNIPRRDSTFTKFNFWNEVNWDPHYHDLQGIHLFEDQILKRVDQNSVDELVAQLKKGGMHIIRINRKDTSKNEDFYDDLWEILWPEGWWEDICQLLERRLLPIANGGLLHVAIIWEHSDESLAENPNLMLDAVSYLQDLDMADEHGLYIDVFYLGSAENGFKLKVAKNKPKE